MPASRSGTVSSLLRGNIFASLFCSPLGGRWENILRFLLQRGSCFASLAVWDSVVLYGVGPMLDTVWYARVRFCYARCELDSVGFGFLDYEKVLAL